MNIQMNFKKHINLINLMKIINSANNNNNSNSVMIKMYNQN